MSDCSRRRVHPLGVLPAILFALNGWVVDAYASGNAGITLEPPGIAEWILTVTAAEGQQVTRVFPRGEGVFLPLGDAALPARDGDYAYVLRADGQADRRGRFTVSGGRIEVHSDSAIVFDQVIPDDLIVQGSLCVGLDCANNEAFGFDTLRLKENNLRINFEDTSTAAGYPSNDWTIEVNASQSGGANYFAILDRTANTTVFRIDAGAPMNALRLSSAGNLGIGTDSPILDVHARTGNTPAVRLEQDASGGFAGQVWDIGANEANFFVRDVTGGSRLPLRVRPGAPTSSIDISTTGNVGVGTSSPAQRLHVVGSARVEGFFNMKGSAAAPAAPAAGEVNLFYETGGRVRMQFSDNTQPFRVVPGTFAGGGGVEVDGLLRMDWGSNVTSPGIGTAYVWHESADGSLRFRFNNGTTALLTGAGVWTDASSRRYKTGVKPLESTDALEALRALSPMRYLYNGGTDEHVGFIAEDVPELVATAGREGLAPMDIVGVLTKVVQDQQGRIDRMSAELAELKAAVELLQRSGK